MAQAIRVHRTGGPEVLTYETVEIGAPAPDEIKIRQTACGLNFIDTYFRTGLYPAPTPFIPGNEGAGEVVAVGSAVTDFRVGDRAAYYAGLGGYASERLLKADRAVKLPDAISDEQAAGMMLKGLTAHYLLFQTYPVKAGDTILVHAAAGGVGLILCQWAAALGATVIGTAGSAEKAKLARAHGCAHTILYGEEDFVARVKDITNGAKCAVVYDGVGKATFPGSLDCLRPRGLFVTFGNASGAVEPVAPLLLSQKGSLFMTRPTLNDYIATTQELRSSAARLFEAVANKTVTIAINQRYALREAEKAHRDLESRKTTGTSVLIP